MQDNKEKRIVGGEDANQAGPNPEFPWDVKLRYVFDWGTLFKPGASQGDIDRNNITGLKEAAYCGAFIYSKRVILTASYCADLGRNYSETGNRFTAWFARKK